MLIIHGGKTSMCYPWEKAEGKEKIHLLFYIPSVLSELFKNVQANLYTKKEKENIPKCFGCVWVMKQR